MKQKEIDFKEQEKKGIFRKTWNFLWKSNSLLSWIFSFAIAFLFVKFIFFPLLSLTLATKLPLVVVKSSSMHHPGSFVGNVIQTRDSFEEWWQSAKEWYGARGITKEQALDWSFKTGLEKGDIIVIQGKSIEELEKGDVIVFNANQKDPIIHRIIDVNANSRGETIFSTKGDNNPDQLISEKEIPQDAIVGKAIARIPKLGWLKLAFVELVDLFRKLHQILKKFLL